MLVGMIFIGALFAIFAVVVSSAIRHNDEVTRQTTLQAEARGAIEQIAQDLRAAYTGDEDTPAIETMTSTQLTFLSADRREPLHVRRVSYRLSSGQLQRAVASSSNTNGPPWTIGSLSSWATRIDDVVSASLFTYRDEDGATTAVPADVSTVEISVTVATGTSPTRQFTYKTKVSLRTGEAL
jgi:type II secretory pathway component PulJ